MLNFDWRKVTTKNAEIAAGIYQSTLEACRSQSGYRFIYRKAFGNAAEIESYPGMTKLYPISLKQFHIGK